VTDGALITAQFRADLRIFWRNPQYRYFTVALPVVILVLLAAIFSGSTVVGHRPVRLTTYYVPSITTMGIISASFVNLCVAVVALREAGVLKRARATPVPAYAVIASRAAVGVVVALVMSALLLVIGRVAYGVRVPSTTMPGLIVAVVVGAAAFCCLGFAFSTVVGATDAAPPAAFLAVMPLYFISGVFVPDRQIPSALHAIAEVFPVYHLSQALLEPFLRTDGMGIAAGHLAVVAAWGLVGLGIASRRFQWSPRSA
jgi:ABC-2 type transport system permease protein